MIAGCDYWNISGWGGGVREGGGLIAAFLIRLGARVGGRLRGDRGSRPTDHGGCGISALARPRNKSASGQAAAKARRTRVVVSMTRAAILSSLSLIVLNSAVASSRTFGMASRTVRTSQWAAVWKTRRTWLASAE